MMDWFEKLTGFSETDYRSAQAKLAVKGGRLQSVINGASYAIGDLQIVSLESLRQAANTGGGPSGRLRVRIVTGDVRQMHRLPEYAGALFQVASQFNCLEMTSPAVTPEHGVTRYENDLTQGPACAIAAGGATIYRNYFVPLGESYGQTADRQIDTLAEVGYALSDALKVPVEALWKMQNGYALCTLQGLGAITNYLGTLTPRRTDALRGKLCIGWHRDIEVTEAEERCPPLVSHAFCSALPVAYSAVPPHHWEPFARLILEAAYEATLWAAVLNARRGASNLVLLTLLGGGVFGNAEPWIISAMRRAFATAAGFDLDVRIVSYESPSKWIVRLADEFR